MAVVWLAVARPSMPRTIASRATTSTNRDWSSVFSSQWMSTSAPYFSARSKANLTSATPSSRENSM